MRSRVFDLIRANADAAQVDSLIVEKRKTHPTLQVEEKFYPRMLGYLLKYVLRKTALDRYAQVIVVTDTIPIKGQRQSMEKAIREALRALLPAGVVFKVLHHASKSCHGLQVADYCCWAIQKRWERGDSQMYDLIQPFLRSEYDIFKGGTEHFY